MLRQRQAATERVECTPVQQRTKLTRWPRPKQRYNCWDGPRGRQCSPRPRFSLTSSRTSTFPKPVTWDGSSTRRSMTLN